MDTRFRGYDKKEAEGAAHIELLAFHQALMDRLGVLAAVLALAESIHL